MADIIVLDERRKAREIDRRKQLDVFDLMLLWLDLNVAIAEAMRNRAMIAHAIKRMSP